jgi:hypothetical protein
MDRHHVPHPRPRGRSVPVRSRPPRPSAASGRRTGRCRAAAGRGRSRAAGCGAGGDAGQAPPTCWRRSRPAPSAPHLDAGARGRVTIGRSVERRRRGADGRHCPGASPDRPVRGGSKGRTGGARTEAATIRRPAARRPRNPATRGGRHLRCRREQGRPLAGSAAGATGSRPRHRSRGQARFRAVSSRYSQSMTVLPAPRSWRRASSARSRSSAATRSGSLAMPR